MRPAHSHVSPVQFDQSRCHCPADVVLPTTCHLGTSAGSSTPPLPSCACMTHAKGSCAPQLADKALVEWLSHLERQGLDVWLAGSLSLQPSRWLLVMRRRDHRAAGRCRPGCPGPWLAAVATPAPAGGGREAKPAVSWPVLGLHARPLKSCWPHKRSDPAAARRSVTEAGW